MDGRKKRAALQSIADMKTERISMRVKVETTEAQKKSRGTHDVTKIKGRLVNGLEAQYAVLPVGIKRGSHHREIP